MLACKGILATKTKELPFIFLKQKSKNCLTGRAVFGAAVVRSGRTAGMKCYFFRNSEGVIPSSSLNVEVR